MIMLGVALSKAKSIERVRDLNDQNKRAVPFKKQKQMEN